MHYRQIIILLVSCLVALGIYGLAHINKNEFPDFTIRQGIVVAVYPGVTSQEMEEQVTKPLEKYIFTYKEVKKEKTISYSKDGLSIIQVELNDELTNKDEFWSKFKHGVQGFKNELPDGVLAIQVNDDFGDTSALLLAMESNEKTYRELNDYMNSLIDSLRMIPSVGKMTVFGLQHDQIRLLTPGNLKALHRTGTEFCIHDPAIPCRDDTIPDLGWHARCRQSSHLLRTDGNHFIFLHQLKDLLVPIVSTIIFTVFTCQTGADHDLHR